MACDIKTLMKERLIKEILSLDPSFKFENDSITITNSKLIEDYLDTYPQYKNTIIIDGNKVSINPERRLQITTAEAIEKERTYKDQLEQLIVNSDMNYSYNGETYDSSEDLYNATLGDPDFMEMQSKINNSFDLKIQLNNYINSKYQIEEDLDFTKVKDFSDLIPYLDQNTKELLDKLKEELDLELIEGHTSFSYDFDNKRGKINFSPNELINWSKEVSFSNKTLINIVLQHELYHALSHKMIENGKYNSQIRDLLNKARKHHSKNQFKDKLRNNYLFENNLPYALGFSNHEDTDIYEFTAEAFSNPWFKNWLNSIQTEETNKSLFDKLLDLVKSFFGIKNGSYFSLYNEINDVLIKLIDESEEELNKDRNIELYANNVKTANQYMVKFLEANDLEKVITSKIEDLINSFKKIKNSIPRDSKNKSVAYDKISNSLKLLDKHEDIITISSILSQMTIVRSILEDIEFASKDIINNVQTNSEKITALHLALKEVRAFDDYVKLANSILTEFNNTERNKGFSKEDDAKTGHFRIVRLLEGVTSPKVRLEEELKGLIGDPIYSYLDELVDPETKEKIKKYEKEIEDLRIKLDDPAYKNKQMIKDKIKAIEDNILSKFPKDTEWFKRELSGDIGELGVHNVWLEAAQQSKSPLVQLISKQFKDLDNENNRENLEVSNEIQKALDEVITVTKSSKLKLDELYKPILTQIEVIEELDENGKITESFKRDSLLNIYTPEYYTEYNRLKKNTQNKGYDLSSTRLKSIKDKNNKDLEKEVSIKKEAYDKAVREFNDFKEKYVEREYNQEYYDVQDLYNSPISSEYPDISLKSVYSDYYHRIDVLQMEVSNQLANGAKEANFDELEFLQLELKRIESLEDKEEGSIEWLIAKKAIEYKEAKSKLGKSILLPENKIFFDKLLASKNNELAKGYLNKEQHAFWMQKNTKTVATEQWYNDRNNIFAELARLGEELDEKMKSLDVSYRSKQIYDANKNIKLGKKDLHKELREITKPFRDNNLVINGILVEKADIKKNTNVVGKVKEIDEAIEYFNQLLVSFKTGVSKGERSSKADKEALKRELEELGIDGILKEMGLQSSFLRDMSKTENTHYYETKYEDELNKLADSITTEELDKEVENNQITLNGIRFIYDTELKKITYVSAGKIVAMEGIHEYDSFLNILRREKAKEKITQSDWYKNNHFEVYSFDNVTDTFSRKMEPISIWTNNMPFDESQLVTLPSSKYFTFQIDDSFINKNHKKLPDGLELPKQGTEYINQEFIRLSNSNDPKDKAYFNLLTKLRDVYYKSQENVTFKNKFGDSTPALLKTRQERKTEGFTKLTNPSEYKNYLKDIYRSYLKEDEQDLNNDLLGMSSREYLENKEIPELLVGKLDSDKQSKNIVGSILIHSLMSSRRNKLMGIQPIMDSILELASEGKVKNTSKSVTGKLITKVKGESSKTDVFTQLKSFIESEMYNHRIDDVKYTVFGMDLNKMLNTVMKVNAFGAFAGNIYNPVKNTVSGKIQSFIDHNKKLGKYSNKQFLEAEKKSIILSNQLLTSYTKFGMKPLEVQLIDYFNVLQGSRTDELGHKSQWSGFRDWTKLLSAPKDYSEFQLQLSQYLAFADNTYLTTKDGRKKLLECFELDKKGNIKPKLFITDLKTFNKEINKFTFILHNLNLELNGAYRQEETSLAQKNILGRAAFFMNKYLLPMMVRRYSNYRYYVAEDDVKRGFYRDAFKFLISDTFSIKEGKINVDFHFINRYNNLSDQEKYNLLKTLKEACIIVLITLLIGGLTGGDEDKEIGGTRKLALAYLMGISMEAQTFNPVAGVDDMIRKIKNPFVFARTLQTSRNAIYYSIMTLIGSDEAEYKRKSGSHEKGDSKAMANFMRLLSLNPGNVLTFDPQTLYQNQKAFYSGQMR